ncbi:invasion associated locus B family protein [Cognatishimia sp. WU-CL00825]|uniref:invasion associated locus B family protein n=1 Tax=Cognatishimia sp. WU-CL00825 TaxID=3127658 RepID=UPI00310BD8CA
MLKINTLIASCLLVGLAGVTSAQEAQPTVPGLSTGETVPPEAPAPQVETEVIGDWKVSCVVQDTAKSCRMNQVLNDNTGQPVVDVTLFPITNAGDITFGGSIMAPLETLLTQQMTISVDGGPARRYPFAFCTTSGCISRIGLAEADINSFRNGANAVVTIIPALAPDQKVELTMSLAGFTKSHETVTAQ